MRLRMVPHTRGVGLLMARIWNDPQLGPIRVLPRSEINAQVIAEILKAQGYNLNNIHCTCCTLKLTDFSKIKMSTQGPVGPECSKPGHVMPCRRHAAPVAWPYDQK